MTVFKNMKIEVNEQQPLDEIVMELERLGFKRGVWWSYYEETKVIEADANTLHLVDYTCCDIEKREGEITTLAELKNMKCV